MELQKIIKETLSQNTYVSLPGLGSFVQNYQPAKLSANGKELLPPVHSISFDTSRTFNDEVIEKYLKEKLAISPSRAVEVLNDFISRLRKRLENGEKADFESIGTLYYEDNVLVFKQADESSRLSKAFGLKPVEFIGKTADKPHFQPPIIEEKDIIAQKEPKGVNKVLVATLATIVTIGVLSSLLFLFVPLFRFWEEPITQKHKVGEQQKKQSKSSPKEAYTDFVTDFSKTEVKEIKTPKEVKETIDLHADKKKALYYEEPKPKDTRTYYIISGSFVSIENAKNHYNYLQKQGFKPEILENDGKFRVAISKFSDRNRALQELERMRQSKPNESVWLLCI